MNSTNQRSHLTESQIDDALIGDLDAEYAAHLTACDECQIRLAEAGAPIAHFNAVSLAWSERRSSTLPLRPAGATEAAPWLPRALWAATAAAVFAMGVAVPVMRHSAAALPAVDSHEAATTTLMASTGPVDNPVAARDEQIARDNQMLDNINRELDTPPASLDREYGPQAVGSHASTHSASAPVRD